MIKLKSYLVIATCILFGALRPSSSADLIWNLSDGNSSLDISGDTYYGAETWWMAYPPRGETKLRG
jgi:hypothetical protein